MNPTARLWLFLVAAAGFGALLLWGMRGLPAFGHYRGPYGDVILDVSPHERRLQNVVTAVNFDYRGLDTLGEEFILFAAVAGVTLLLRKPARGRGAARRRSSGDSPQEEKSETERAALRGDAATPSASARTSWSRSPSSSACTSSPRPSSRPAAASRAASSWRPPRCWSTWPAASACSTALSPTKALEAAEALGAGGYALVGLAALLPGGAFLENVLPLGHIGSPALRRARSR